MEQNLAQRSRAKICMRTCTVDGCDGEYLCRGWCRKHYSRWYRHGDLISMGIIRQPAENRFWVKVDKRSDDECWEWIGCRSNKGYGWIVDDDSQQMVASRFSWRLHNGPIPDGMLICHTCDNPPCVNPQHLFLGTKTDNMRDMVAKGRGRWDRV